MNQRINNQEKNKKAFRPSNARFQNSFKILSGTKTNATIRDLDEEEDELEEIDGVVVSIERNKINGDGWTVKADDGTEYKCHVASSMYEIPDTVEKGGILYPTETIKVKVSISPTLRRNSITEFIDLKDDETTVDIGKFKHEDEATTVIAKPMSAISISDSLIKFNYNNTNQVIANKDGVDIEGNSTNINTDKVEINAKEILINGKSLKEEVSNIQNENNKNNSALTTYTAQNLSGDNIFVDKEGNLTQLTLNDVPIKKNEDEKVIVDILNQDMWSLRQQKFNNDNNTLSVYPNGVVTIKERDAEISFLLYDEEEYEAYELTSFSISWLSPQNGLRNCIEVESPYKCKKCQNKNVNDKSIFLNYCPLCGWGKLTNYGQHIICNECKMIFCGNCGEIIDNKDNNIQGTLKFLDNNKISSIGTKCKICKNSNIKNIKKIFANFCPVCGGWNTLTKQESEDNILFYCSKCKTKYCSNCGINQKAEAINSFVNEDVYYLGETNNYLKDYNRQKLYYINKEE